MILDATNSSMRALVLQIWY